MISDPDRVIEPGTCALLHCGTWRAHARELFSDRRGAPGLTAEAPRRHLGVLRSLPQGLRRHRGVADGKSHLQAAQRQYRRGQARRCLGLGVFRCHGSWLRCHLGSAQGAAYECYSELDFDIPIGKNGDNYDRYCIRMEEMRQSVRIMKQCLEKL